MMLNWQLMPNYVCIGSKPFVRKSEPNGMIIASTEPVSPDDYMDSKSYTEELLFRWLPANVNSGLMDLKHCWIICVDYIQPGKNRNYGWYY